MISFNYESDFSLEQEDVYASWIETIVKSEKKTLGEISYIFCEASYISIELLAIEFICGNYTSLRKYL